VGTEGKLDLTPRRSRRSSSVGYSRSKQDPRHYSWAVAAYALRSGRPLKGLLEVLALLRFRGLLNPVKHPAARLDNGTGSDPVSSHPVGYGVRLSVFVSSRPVGAGEGHAGMPARVRLPTVGAVDRLSIFAKFDFKVSLLVGAGGDSAFNRRGADSRTSKAGTRRYRGNHDSTLHGGTLQFHGEARHDTPLWSPPDGPCGGR
jgi:hypothetical protein